MSWFSRVGWQPSAADMALQNAVRANTLVEETAPVPPQFVDTQHQQPPKDPTPSPKEAPQTSTLKKTALGVGAALGIGVTERILHNTVVTPVVNTATEHGPGIVGAAFEAVGGAADTVYDSTVGFVFGPLGYWGSSYLVPKFVKRITVAAGFIGCIYLVAQTYKFFRPAAFGTAPGLNNNVFVSISQVPLTPLRVQQSDKPDGKEVHIAMQHTPEQEQKIKNFKRTAASLLHEIPKAVQFHQRIIKIAEGKLGLLSKEMGQEIMLLKARFDELKERSYVNSRLRLNLGVAELVLEAAEKEIKLNEPRAESVLLTIHKRQLDAQHRRAQNAATGSKKRKFRELNGSTL